MTYLRDINLLSVLLRMVLALVCGGLIGYERGSKGKSAGLRTHIMVCIGSAIVTCTSQYLLLVQHQCTDIARLGAQVVAGLGFIGAGTIVMTQYRRIKGLTTAAGLWVTGIIGLCCGAGFYEGAALATLLLLFAGNVLEKLEKKHFTNAETIRLFMEYPHADDLRSIMEYLRDVDVEVESFEVNKHPQEGRNASGVFSLKLHRKISVADIMSDLKSYSCVSDIYELKKAPEDCT